MSQQILRVELSICREKVKYMGFSEVCNLINNVFRRNRNIFSLNQIEVHLGTSGWTCINGFATHHERMVHTVYVRTGAKI